MKILLSHGYYIHEDIAERKIMMPYPPQGILHIGTYLRSKGLDCSIFDSTFSSFQDFCDYLVSHSPQYLGLYVNLMTRPNILKIIRFIRKSDLLKDMVIILGGSDVRHHAKLYVENGADYCISGEGEKTLLHLINILEKNSYSKLADINGLTYKDLQKGITSTREPELIKNIDDIPFPDFEMIDVQKYLSTWKSNHGYSSLSISTMRGCPYSCRWCSKAVFGNSLRRRSTSSVIKEIKRLHEVYSPDRFWVVDDVFTINKKWLTEFTTSLSDAKLSIKYECITRADKMDHEVISLLKESGCFRVWIGAESGSQKVLDLMDRRVKASTVREMIIATNKSGIETGTFLMVGYPGEDEKDILETVKHLKNASPDHITITLSYPIPGTGFYDDVKNNGLKIPGKWGTYSDRDLDFKRTYKNRFYYYAVRYINNEVKAHRNFKQSKLFTALKHSLKSKILRLMMILNR